MFKKLEEIDRKYLTQFNSIGIELYEELDDESISFDAIRHAVEQDEFTDLSDVLSLDITSSSVLIEIWL